METINMNFTQLEFDSLIIEMLMAVRLEQMRTRSFLDAFADTSLSQEQKKVFRPLLKKQLLSHLAQLGKDQSALFLEVIHQLISDVNSSEEFTI